MNLFQTPPPHPPFLALIPKAYRLPSDASLLANVSKQDFRSLQIPSLSTFSIDAIPAKEFFCSIPLHVAQAFLQPTGAFIA